MAGGSRFRLRRFYVAFHAFEHGDAVIGWPAVQKGAWRSALEKGP